MKAHLNTKGNKRGMHSNHARGERSHCYRHGMKDSPLYTTWVHINYRCNDTNYKQWNNYGGKGVKLSDEFQDFKVFHDYMMSIGWYKGCHVSRKNDLGNYERDNIEIKTPQENRQEAVDRVKIKVKNIDLDMIFNSVYEAAEYIQQHDGYVSKRKTIAENIRCKGLKGSVSYGYRWEVV